MTKVAGGKFTPKKDAQLNFSLKGVSKDVTADWPNLVIAEVLRRRVDAPELQEIGDLRRVLFHRGTLPRMVFASENSPDAIPANPGDPADRWRYDLKMTPNMVDRNMTWCDDTIAELITALEQFTAGW